MTFWHPEEPAEPDLPTIDQVQAFQRAHGLEVQELPEPVPFPTLLLEVWYRTNTGGARVDDMAAALRELGPDALEAHAREMREDGQARRVKVPEGQTPLNDDLGHRYLDVVEQGSKARDTGASSPYHGHSLEHCLHAVGWVQRDLRLALDKMKENPDAG